ncbi:hypothetical protein [Pseudomonas bohemica]|uniref:hypothetical protein n=1 Tax=Pseudomonas bohemica TaxID=2044872 RepID=UPI000DA5F21F|nr:hypothetical protein [Pseudomonas bohemica]
MKLILKRVAREIEVTALGDESRKFVAGKASKHSPFALHTEAGEVLPCQVSTNMASEAGDLVRLTVVFTVDGESLRVEGDDAE